MNRLTLTIATILTGIVLYSCTQPNAKHTETIAKVQVKVTSVEQGYLPNYISFTGKTVYLNKINLMAPISGYVTKVNVKKNEKVKKGRLLFEIKSAEAFVMQNSDSLINNYGLIKIYAPVNGQLVDLNISNSNVFADKNAIMCNIIATNNLKIEVNIPFEYNNFAKIGNKCKVILPDNTEIQGLFSQTLPQIDESSQSIRILADIKVNRFIPENMIVKILIDQNKKHKAQIIPKECLQTDALMTEFWVMKLINDTAAVQIPVKVGVQSHLKVEILEPQFTLNDKIIIEGAYGLSDTVFVNVMSQL